MKRTFGLIAIKCVLASAILAQSAVPVQRSIPDQSPKPAQSSSLSSIDNPVLPGVADAGVIKFRGEYYVGGVGTLGSLYKSGDLVHWSGPVHVFTMNNEWATPFGIGNEQIHSNDINYINGVFHMYWNVNYWGKDRNVIHIGHATATDISGPFTEPDKRSWFDSRLDPKLFVDDDGRMYFYSVKFTDGNTIWGCPMKDPGTLTGQPRYLFASMPGTWETLDNRVEEGPWVFKYRSRYFMMFNCNHTSPEWGNYALGVAEASGPLEFNNGGKYPYPVLQSNQVELEEKYVDILKYSGTGDDDFRYTVATPDTTWGRMDFVDTAWKSGRGGFGSERILHSTTHAVNTDWKEKQIWIRKKFILHDRSAEHFALRIHHDGDTRIFLNGMPVYTGTGRNYLIKDLDPGELSALKSGENILTGYSIRGEKTGFADVALFDMKEGRADDILITPGQANILRGPDGFEWWLVYMANKNQERRGQFVNRIHFFDKRLVVDGMTSLRTKGYHPDPALPTFGDLFNDSTVSPGKAWDLRSGRWKLADGAMVLSAGAAGAGREIAGIAFPKSKPAVNYLFEVSVKPAGQQDAGIYAWWKDAGNWMRVGISAQKRSWFYEICLDKKVTTASFRLAGDFDYQVYHKIGLYKNEDRITLYLDDLPAPGHPCLSVSLPGKGIPGLYTKGTGSSFDGALYTIGWDEFDSTVTGWKPLNKGNESGWAVTAKGLQSLHGPGEAVTVKGDLLNSYEFSAQVTVEGIRDSAGTGQGSAGILPVYIDKQNFLKAGFDYGRQRFVVSGILNGLPLETQEVDLSSWQPYYTDMTQSDAMERHFVLHTTTVIDGMKISKAELAGMDSLVSDIPANLLISFRRGSTWKVLDYKLVKDEHPGFARIAFPGLAADEIRIENKRANNAAGTVHKIWVHERAGHSYNFRVTRRKNELYLSVDNEQVMRLKIDFPASQVGLYTFGCKADFNGLMSFHLPGN